LTPALFFPQRHSGLTSQQTLLKLSRQDKFTFCARTDFLHAISTAERGHDWPDEWRVLPRSGDEALADLSNNSRAATVRKLGEPTAAPYIPTFLGASWCQKE
jgi:hypothetical protein